MIKASHTIAVSIGKGPYMARKIRALYRHVAHFQTLPPTNVRKHHAHPSLLNNEQIAQAIRQYLTVLHDGEVSKSLAQITVLTSHDCCQITPVLLAKQVNTVILPALGLDSGGQNISEKKACQWLAKLGYELKEVKKGVYVDEHEQEDVVASRSEFLVNFGAYERYVLHACTNCSLM